MRQNVVIVLLSVCCTLLAVNLYVSLHGSSGALPPAHGQAAAGTQTSVALATVQGTSNDPWVYIYDVTSQRLGCYKTGNTGIEFKGLRQLTWDLKLEELNPKLATTGKVPVATIRKELDKSGN